MKNDSIGNRMKSNYEFRQRYYLTRRTPVILRLDGRSFSQLTRKCIKPFDCRFASVMDDVATYLVTNIQGAKCAYKQSDEISILLTDFDTFTTDAWFDYNKSKIESISAGMASASFSLMYDQLAMFDCRAFNLPKEEVCNYFIWRQQDWIRNSVNMLASSLYSDKELFGKNNTERQDMIYEKGLNWSELDDKWKNGSFVTRCDISYTTVFTKSRSCIDDLLIAKED